MQLFVVRYGAFVPIMLVLLGLMFTRLFKRVPQLILSLFCCFMGIHFSVCAIIAEDWKMFYYQSVLWPIAFAFIFLGVQTMIAIALSVLLIGTMFLGINEHATEVLLKHQMIYQIVYFACYAYIFEMGFRKEFLLRRVVDRER